MHSVVHDIFWETENFIVNGTLSLMKEFFWDTLKVAPHSKSLISKP